MAVLVSAQELGAASHPRDLLRRGDYLAVPDTAIASVYDDIAAAALPDELSRFPRGCVLCPMTGPGTPRATLHNLPATLPIGHDVRLGPRAGHRRHCCRSRRSSHPPI